MTCGNKYLAPAKTPCRRNGEGMEEVCVSKFFIIYLHLNYLQLVLLLFNTLTSFISQISNSLHFTHLGCKLVAFPRLNKQNIF